MSIVTHEAQDKLGATILGQQVSASGMTVTVGAGTFTVGGEEHELGEDFSHDLAPSPSKRFVEVFLVKHKVDGDVVVAVDETVEMDPGYDWDGSPYDVLARLAFFTMPADADDLAGVDIHVPTVVKPEEEEDGDGGEAEGAEPHGGGGGGGGAEEGEGEPEGRPPFRVRD